MTSVKSLNFSCIENADQLWALFKAFPTPRYRDPVSLLLFHMRIDVAAFQNSSNTSVHLEDKCCEPFDAQDVCRTTAVYSRAIYTFLPFPLVKAFLFPIVTIKKYLRSGFTFNIGVDSVEEICWTLPLPFCPGSKTILIIGQFLSQVKNNGQVTCITCMMNKCIDI